MAARYDLVSGQVVARFAKAQADVRTRAFATAVYAPLMRACSPGQRSGRRSVAPATDTLNHFRRLSDKIEALASTFPLDPEESRLKGELGAALRAYLSGAAVAIEQSSVSPSASRQVMRQANADYDRASQIFASFIGEARRSMESKIIEVRQA